MSEEREQYYLRCNSCLKIIKGGIEIEMSRRCEVCNEPVCPDCVSEMETHRVICRSCIDLAPWTINSLLDDNDYYRHLLDKQGGSCAKSVQRVKSVLAEILTKDQLAVVEDRAFRDLDFKDRIDYEKLFALAKYELLDIWGKSLASEDRLVHGFKLLADCGLTKECIDTIVREALSFIAKNYKGLKPDVSQQNNSR